MSSCNKAPLVSIIVTVYNGENYLRRCIESLVYQTFKRKEIICVDKSSTDGTARILQEYKDQFQDILSVYTIPYSDTPAAGRNYGIKQAKGDYITFADADDFMCYDMVEKLYNEAKLFNYDLVYCQFYELQNRTKSIQNILDIPLTKTALIEHSNISFWNKLFKRSILEANGEILETTIFDDFSYVLPLLSKLSGEKIGYVAEPLYFHILREDSESQNSSSQKIINAITAAVYVLQHAEPKCRTAVMYRIAKWMQYNIAKRCRYSTEFIAFIKANAQEIVSNKDIKKDFSLYGQMQLYISITDKRIPSVIYVNGFCGIAEERLDELKLAFNEGATITVLDETNCDLSEVPPALSAEKDYDHMAKYFAMKLIFQKGGVYIGKRISDFVSTFDTLSIYECFFSRIDDNEYSTEIFGGMAESEVIESIIDGYDNDVAHGYYSLKDRIKTILTAKYSVPLANETFINSKIAVFTPLVMVYNIKDTEIASHHICVHNFDDMADNPEYTVVKKTLLRKIGVNANNAELVQKYNCLSKEMSDIKQSGSYGLAKKLARLKNTFIGRVLYNLIKLFSRRRTKRAAKQDTGEE